MVHRKDMACQGEHTILWYLLSSELIPCWSRSLEWDAHSLGCGLSPAATPFFFHWINWAIILTCFAAWCDCGSSERWVKVLCAASWSCPWHRKLYCSLIVYPLSHTLRTDMMLAGQTFKFREKQLSRGWSTQIGETWLTGQPGEIKLPSHDTPCI